MQLKLNDMELAYILGMFENKAIDGDYEELGETVMKSIAQKINAQIRGSHGRIVEELAIIVVDNLGGFGDIKNDCKTGY